MMIASVEHAVVERPKASERFRSVSAWFALKELEDRLSRKEGRKREVGCDSDAATKMKRMRCDPTAD